MLSAFAFLIEFSTAPAFSRWHASVSRWRNQTTTVKYPTTFHDLAHVALHDFTGEVPFARHFVREFMPQNGLRTTGCVLGTRRPGYDGANQDQSHSFIPHSRVLSGRLIHQILLKAF